MFWSRIGGAMSCFMLRVGFWFTIGRAGLLLREVSESWSIVIKYFGAEASNYFFTGPDFLVFPLQERKNIKMSGTAY